MLEEKEEKSLPAPLKQLMEAIESLDIAKVKAIVDSWNAPKQRSKLSSISLNDKGDTLMHFAVRHGNAEVIKVFNFNYRDGGGKIAFAECNKDGLRPLSLCCQLENKAAFDALWQRAGKSNHNPSDALPYAEMASDKYFLEQLQAHPKIAQTFRGTKRKSESQQTSTSLPFAKAARAAVDKALPSSSHEIKP